MKNLIIGLVVAAAVVGCGKDTEETDTIVTDDTAVVTDDTAVVTDDTAVVTDDTMAED